MSPKGLWNRKIGIDICCYLWSNCYYSVLDKLSELEINHIDSTGWSALHHAVYLGDYETVKTLLSHSQIRILFNEDDDDGTANEDEVDTRVYDIICGKEGCDITQAEAISNLLDIKLSRQTVNKEARQRQHQDNGIVELSIQDPARSTEEATEKIYSYDMNNYDTDLQYCIEHQDKFLQSHYYMGIFGESKSGKTTFVKNLSQKRFPRGEQAEEEYTLSHNLPKFAIETTEFELLYTINHHYDSRLWTINPNPPERKLESALATWIYENNFIYDSPRINSLSKGISRSSSASFRGCESGRGNTEFNAERILLINEGDVRHDFVKKYLAQQYHVQQSKMLLTVHDYSGAPLYHCLHPFFYPNHFYHVNIVVFNMESLLSLTTRQESINQLKYWINQILIRSNPPVPDSSGTSPSSIDLAPFYIILIGTHKDSVPKITDHIKISNLLYEKLQDLPIWNQIITNPYLGYDQQDLVYSPLEPSTPLNGKDSGSFSPPDYIAPERISGKRSKHQGLDLWFYPIDHQVQGRTDPSFVTLRNEMEEVFHHISRQKQKKMSLRRGLIPLNRVLTSSSGKPFSRSSLSIPNISISAFKYLQLIDQLFMQSNPFLTRATFLQLLRPIIQSSVAVANTALHDIVALFLQFLHEKAVLLWYNQLETIDVIVINPLEYLLKPLNYLIYEHVSINTETPEELFPSHELSKFRFPNEWQQMIKYGILSEELLQSLILPYEHYSKQLIFIFSKLNIVLPIAVRPIATDFSDAESELEVDDISNDGNQADRNNFGDYYYLIPSLFPTITDNKLFSGSHQPFNSCLTFYYYFQLSPPSSTNFHLTEFLSWSDLRRNGSLPEGLFELLLTKMIYYSQQTSHDLHLKFTEHASKLYRERSLPSSPPSTSAKQRSESDIQTNEHYQQQILMHSYHHLFYKNQMILQFGSWRFRITKHLEYNILQIELESLPAFPVIEKKITGDLKEFLATFYPLSSLRVYTLLLSSPSHTSLSSPSKDGPSLANVFEKLNDTTVPNYKRKDVFLFDYQLMLALSSFPSTPLNSDSYDRIGSNVDDSQFLSVFQSSPVLSRSSSTDPITFPAKPRNSLKLALNNHLMVLSNQIMTKYEPLFQSIAQQKNSSAAISNDVYFSLVRSTLESQLHVQGINTLKIASILIEGVTYRLGLYSINDPLEIQERQSKRKIVTSGSIDFEGDVVNEASTRSKIAPFSSDKGFNDCDVFGEHRFHRSASFSSKTLPLEAQRFEQILQSSIIVPVIPFTLIQFFEAISSNTTINEDNYGLFEENSLTEEKEMQSVEQCVYEWIVARYFHQQSQQTIKIVRGNLLKFDIKFRFKQILPIFIGSIEESHRVAASSASKDSVNSTSAGASILLSPGGFSAPLKQFQFHAIDREHISSISDSLIPRKVIKKFQAVLSIYSLANIEEIDYSKYSIPALLSFFRDNIPSQDHINSWQYMRPYDYYIEFTRKIVEKILIQLREIQIIEEEEEISKEQDELLFSKENVLAEESAPSHYSYETPVRKKSLFGRDQIICNNNDQYYYEQYLSPKQSPSRFFPQRPLSTLQSSRFSNMGEKHPCTAEAISVLNKSKTIVSIEECQFLIELFRYFQEIALIQSNHNYTMNYYLFQLKKRNQIAFENSPSLMKQYYQEIKSPITNSTSSKTSSYIILFESIQEYYQRITEIYFELIHQYELRLELLILSYREIPRLEQKATRNESIATFDTIEIVNGIENFAKETQTPKRAFLQAEFDMLNVEINSIDQLYQIYYQYLAKKKYLQTILKEVLMVYPDPT